jgi:hypothetical protein
MLQQIEKLVTDDPFDAANMLGQINVFIARAATILADAKEEQDMARAMLFKTEFSRIKSLSPSLAKVYVDSLTVKENKLVNKTERLNRACVHQGDNLRTIISLYKENLKLTRSGY